jgi:signal transduction histidine kinase/ligand-binding sensor domain-containing protein
MMRRLSAILLCILLAALPGVGTAAPYERSVFQYTHQRWSAESDAPRPVAALTQDQHGYLWVASATGLFRFDGIRFEPVGHVDLTVNGAPSALLVRRNGDVWTNFDRSRRFAIYRDGRLQFMRAPPSPDRVIAMEEAPDGTVWVLTAGIGHSLLRYHDRRWTAFGAEAGVPLDDPFSMVVTSDGAVWVSFSNSVARLPVNGSRFEIVRRTPTPTGQGRLSLDPRGRVWLTERRGSYPITGPGGRGAPPPLRYPYATDSAEIRGVPAFDREGNLWIATYYDGLQRVAHPDPRGAASPAEAVSRVEHFTARDGLSSNATTQIFQDVEGNVWAATDNGLDRFWPATLRFEPELTHPAAFGDLLLQASDGSVYIGESSTVYRVRPGGRPEPILKTQHEPRTLCEASDGAIWIGVSRRVAIWRNDEVRWLPQRAPVDQTIYDCAFDASGAYWVTAARGGMVRYSAGRWTRMPDAPGDAFLPTSMVSDDHGRIVVQWNNRLLSRFDGGSRRSIAIPFGGYEPDVVSLYPGSPGTLFAAGRFGLAQLRDGQFKSISARRMPLLSGVNGMVRTPAGDFWLAGPAGIMRVAPAELERAFADPGYKLSMQVFGAADGLASRPHSHSRHSIVRGGDGRLWIATQTGTIWLDPRDVVRSRTPPKVAISTLSADRVYHDPSSVTLPAGTSNVEIDFAVLSFSDPSGARVRYRMEGQDAAWVDAGTRRQAFYTNLAPGAYRFRLVAANEAGVWNDHGATLQFVIPPTFTQSRWFLLLCVLMALALVWGLLRWRYVQATRRLRARLEERIGERERIARDLHDTLLQGVQGLVFTVQAVADRLARDDSNRASLESALDQADDVIRDGRERVRALRGREDVTDLARVIRGAVDAAPFDLSVETRVTIEGRSRAAHPYVVSELSLIAAEALRNVAHHARASKVEASIGFERRRLTIRFLDNGVGIPDAILRKGEREGHFGLIGMRERAERIGGTFKIANRSGGGAEVTVTLAARFAYLHTGVPASLKRLIHLFADDPVPGQSSFRQS